MVSIWFSKTLNDTLTDEFIEKILYDKYKIRLIDNIGEIYGAISSVTNNYGCLYLKGGIDIKVRMGEDKIIGDIDFGCYCRDPRRFNEVDIDSSLICEKLVKEISRNDKYIDLVSKHINDLVDYEKFYIVFNSYNNISNGRRLGNLTNVSLECSYSEVNITEVGVPSKLRLFRIHYRVRFSSGIVVKLLLFDIGMNDHHVKLEEWIVPRLTITDLCLDQCYCLIKSITSNSKKIDKRITRVKFLLKAARIPNSFMIDLIHKYILSTNLPIIDMLKPQTNELEYEMRDRSLHRYIEEDIKPLAVYVLNKFN